MSNPRTVSQCSGRINTGLRQKREIHLLSITQGLNIQFDEFLGSQISRKVQLECWVCTRERIENVKYHFVFSLHAQSLRTFESSLFLSVSLPLLSLSCSLLNLNCFLTCAYIYPSSQGITKSLIYLQLHCTKEGRIQGKNVLNNRNITTKGLLT